MDFRPDNRRLAIWIGIVGAEIRYRVLLVEVSVILNNLLYTTPHLISIDNTENMSSLTKLMNEQKKASVSYDNTIHSYNGTITTAVSVETSPDDEDEAYDPRNGSKSLSTASRLLPRSLKKKSALPPSTIRLNTGLDVVDAPPSVRNDEILAIDNDTSLLAPGTDLTMTGVGTDRTEYTSSSAIPVQHSRAPSVVSKNPSFKNSLSSSFSQLSINIPYSAPGNHKPSQSLSSSNMSSSFTNMPINGQFITGNSLASPTVSSSQIDSRFIVSKQKIEARTLSASHNNKSSSTLSSFFSKSRRSTATNFDGVSASPGKAGMSTTYHPSSTSHFPSQQNPEGVPPPQSSFDSNSSSTRHSSMADLRRFFKRSSSINQSSVSSSPRVSNLSAGLTSQRKGSVSINVQGNAPSNNNGLSVNSPSAHNSSLSMANSNFPPPLSSSSSSTHLFNASNTYSPIQAPPNAITINNGTPNSHLSQTPNSLYGKSPGSGLVYGSGSPEVTRHYDPSPKVNSLSTSASSTSTINNISIGGNTTSIPFSKRYVKFGENLGAGAGGQVKLLRRLADNKVFAVKEFRAKFTTESKRDYTKKITSEYCIGSTLKHPNVIETIEISFENDRLVQVMEYCDYDLFAIVMSNKMTENEINCCFKQILNGLRYIHSIGLAHRDLKLDNCVINKDGIVKIIDFGSAVVYQYPFSNKLIEATGIVGSDPYLAPEVCVFNTYDPRPVDIWSIAIMYCCMVLKKFPWKIPKLSDPSFKAFASREPGVTFGELLKRLPDSLEPSPISSIPEGTEIEGHTASDKDTNEAAGEPIHTSDLIGEDRLLKALKPAPRKLIGKMVRLAPACRISIDEIFETPWIKSLEMCSVVNENGEPANNGKLVPGSDHTHTQVDQSVAHIACFERAKKKQAAKK